MILAIRNLVAVSIPLLVCGCVAQPEPIVDLKGLDPDVFATDLEECAAYADEVSIAGAAAKGAVAGAVVGATSGAISGAAGPGAGYGGVYGATTTGINAEREKKLVFVRCLEGRGYRVLNY
jgi:hypothetical protein